MGYFRPFGSTRRSAAYGTIMKRKISLRERQIEAEIRRLEAQARLFTTQTISEKVKWWKQLAFALMTVTASYFGSAVGSIQLPTSLPPRPPEEDPIIKKEDPDHVRSYILKTVERGQQAVKQRQDLAAVTYEMINELKVFRQEQTVDANRDMIDRWIQELGKISKTSVIDAKRRLV